MNASSRRGAEDITEEALVCDRPLTTHSTAVDGPGHPAESGGASAAGRLKSGTTHREFSSYGYHRHWLGVFLVSIARHETRPSHSAVERLRRLDDEWFTADAHLRASTSMRVRLPSAAVLGVCSLVGYGAGMVLPRRLPSLWSWDAEAYREMDRTTSDAPPICVIAMVAPNRRSPWALRSSCWILAIRSAFACLTRRRRHAEQRRYSWRGGRPSRSRMIIHTPPRRWPILIVSNAHPHNK